MNACVEKKPAIQKTRGAPVRTHAPKKATRLARSVVQEPSALRDGYEAADQLAGTLRRRSESMVASASELIAATPRSACAAARRGAARAGGTR